MIKKIKKSLLITSLLAASFLGFGAVASLNTVEAKATTTTDFETVFGASIRISEPNGIRFKMQVSEATKTEVFAGNSGKSLGMYIFLGSKIDTVDYSTLSQKIELSFTEDDLYKVGDYWYANGVMTNLYVQNFNKEFVGVGYIATTDGEKTTYEYSKVNAADNVRSISNVAIEAYNDPEANVQTEMVALIEKAVYAKYGVVESREKTEGVTIYSFAKDENTWDSYEKMQAALPISLSVNQKDLHVGESLDLGAALTVNNTNIVGLDIPFSYSVDSEAVTLKDGVATAVGTGTANVTVSFGKYTQTVEINVTEEANVVFNPASSTAKEQVSVNGAGFNYGKDVTTTFVSADKNGNETYGGAYMHIVSSTTGWGNVFVTPVHEMDVYKDYDAVSAWIYVESSKAENFNATFLGADVDLSRVIPTNQWMQITIPMSKFAEKGDGSVNFASINYTATMNAVCIGEIKGINYEDTPEVVFDPAMGNTMQITLSSNKGIFTNVAKQFVSAAQNEDETYSGAYLKITANNVDSTKKWGDIFVNSLNSASSYADYTHIKVWAYIESGYSDAVNASMWGGAQAFTPNQWFELKIPVDTFITNNASAFFAGNFFNTKWGITGVRIGEIIAVKEVRTDVFVFDPASADASSQVSATGKAFDGGATYSFVASSADTTYSGAYVKIGSTALIATNQWGNVFITPASDLEVDASYKSIKAWIYVEGNGSDDITWAFYGVYSQTFARNKWVQIEIPIETYIENAAKVFVGGNFATNASWGITGIRIGEITAVK